MAEEVEKEHKKLRLLDFDSMSDEEEEKNELGSSISSAPYKSGYVSFPQKRASIGGSGIGVDSASTYSVPERASTFDPYAASTMSNSTNAGTFEDEELLFFESTDSVNPTAPSVAASNLTTTILSPNSLFDDDDSTAATMSVELPTFTSSTPGEDQSKTRATSSLIPGAAGYLEMEEEPPREDVNTPTTYHGNSADQAIRTDSGLLLTHRKVPTATTQRNHSHPQQHLGGLFRNAQQDYFEVENGFFRGRNNNNNNGNSSNTEHFQNRRANTNIGYGGMGSGAGKHSMVMVQARRLMSFVKIWMVVFAVVLLFMTGALFHSFGHKENLTKVESNSETTSLNDNFLLPDSVLDVPDEILLLPLNGISQLSESYYNQHHSQHHRRQQLQQIQFQPLHEPASAFPPRRFLRELRHEFEEWIMEHRKSYHSEEEKEKRFSVWTNNHQRTMEKNDKHGPCKLTNQHVFGSNQFKDLAPEEFQAKYLTGYKGVFTDELERKMQDIPEHLRKDSGVVLDPSIHKVEFHESVKHRLLKYSPQVEFESDSALQGSMMNCKWYDLSCILRWIWRATGIQFGSIIGTMEPKYDSNAYPNAVDWRNIGAVTDVRTQGDCGACWAVTAVETVESAYFLATFTLYELSESEIIACDDSCEMCSGGWPQNAYEWVMKYGGLPLYETFPYDADTLKALTQAIEGESDYYDEESVKAYREGVCPAGDNGKSHDSNDNSYWEGGKDNEDYADYSSQGRYGNIRGYGYATERCICYTDGSGCDCDDQDEDTAVRNVASYGPAVVCLEASTWQDYNGGIMTSDIGCGQEFLAMNHCVQVVGYAFTTDAACEGEDCNDNNNNQKSGSGSKSGSRDSSKREGYWIVRNQWGTNWGMNGYAYVAMGQNTCGILNDMTIAYA